MGVPLEFVMSIIHIYIDESIFAELLTEQADVNSHSVILSDEYNTPVVLYETN